MLRISHIIVYLSSHLFFFLSGTIAKIIHVTQGSIGSDQPNCGSCVAPCKTVRHAVDISNSSDTILIDGGHEQQYEYNLNKTLLIDKELILSSNSSSQKAIISIKPNKSVRSFFNIKKKFTLTAVTLHVNPTIGVSNMSCLLSISASNINVTLTNTIFQNTPLQFNFTNKIKANVFMKDCVMENTLSLIMHRTKSTFRSNANVGKKILSTDKGVTINVNQCNFRKSFINLYDQENCAIDIKRSSFSNSVLLISSEKVSVINSSFWNSLLYCESGTSDNYPRSQLLIQNVSFNGSSNQMNTFQLTVYNCDNATIKYCTFANTIYGTLLAFKSNVSLIGSKFTDNTIFTKNRYNSAPGVVYFSGSSVSIKECHFENNAAPNIETGMIMFKNIDHHRPGILISNTTIRGGILPGTLNNALMTILTEVDHRLFTGTINISCPVNYKIFYFDYYDKVISFCQKCDSNKYSLESPYILWNNAEKPFEGRCLPCPYEAVCDQGIRSKGNYWGFKFKKNLIKFVYCPTSTSSCFSYDTCYKNRHKRLCGECLIGHSVGIFGHNQCFKSLSCVRSYFWIIYVLLVGFYLLFFLYLQEIFIFFRRIIQILICYNEISSKDDERYDKIVEKDDLEELSCQLVVSDNTTSMEYQKKSCITAGLIKIVFFFYQTALIIRINSSAKTHYVSTGAADLVLSFFNVKIDISSTSIKICPFESSDALSVEIIKSGILILCPFILLFIALVYSTTKQIFSHINHFHQKRNSKDENTKCFSIIDNRVPSYAKLPFIVRVKRTYVQLLLISFASVALLLFKMINCVEILGQKYLFIKATIPCYTVWQKGLIGLIGGWVIPFWISLYISCGLLRNCEISPNEFLFISLFPFTVLYYFLKAKFSKAHTFMNANNAMLAKEFLRVINEPFRNVSGKSYKLQRESTLLCRRLSLIIVCTFFISLFEKLYPIGLILGLYLTHHIIVQPYDDILLNVIEGISLVALCFLTILNTFWAFTDEAVITKKKLFEPIGQVFIYVELGFMLAPILAVFDFVLAFLCRKCLYKRNEHWQKHD